MLIMYMLDVDVLFCDVMEFKFGDIIFVEMLEIIIVLIEDLFMFRVKLGCSCDNLVLKIVEKIVRLILVKFEL